MKVSAVMPTYNREQYIPIAIRSFLQQTHSDKELVIVDDGNLFDSGLIPNDNRIVLIHLKDRTPTGTKRNIGAEQATGEIIFSWDDDDFSAAHRMEDQIQRLLKTGKAVTGYNTTTRFDEATRKLYASMACPPYFVSGTSQCYWRTWWKRNPFPDCSFGEDSVFSRTARLANELAAATVGKMMVVRRHANNTDNVLVSRLRQLTVNDISDEFFDANDALIKDTNYMYAPHRCSPECQAEAQAQFDSPLADEGYKIDSWPEIQTR